MKQLIILTFFFLTSGYCHLQAGIDFFSGTFEEAKAAAADQGRLIFVDAYTTWCGPCKRMSRNVFTDDAVGELFNSAFVNVKLDMEKGEGAKFQRKYGVTAFPTLLFLDSGGEVVHRVVGGMDVPNFLKLGNFAASKSNVSAEMDQAYADGQRDPEFMAKYIEGLSKANRPLLKITNSYLDGQEDLSTEENLKILFYGSVEADSRIFNQMVKHDKEIKKLVGEEALDEQILKAANKTVEKAIQFQSSDLLEEAIDKVDRYASRGNKDFEDKARLKYYEGVQDIDNYLKTAKSYVRGDTERKFEVASYVLKNMSHHKDALQSAEEWAREACEEEATEPHFFTAAQLMYLNGDYDDSLTYARQALELSKKGKTGARPYIEKLVKNLEEKT